ncbi:MAG TPA: phenylalanine--tRNA ligase subunit beta [Verrucomicrobiales bacterium]|nr:phenylalanine--tRNA ligase subunit beta [Verrucomicrobiales bacterium]
MKVSLSWLSDHLDLTGRPVSELADLLTFAGVEVEGIHERGLSSDRIVVAQVQSFEKHPNADKLRLCQVDDGSGKPRQIVCGAKNFVAGDKVPLALPGAVLPGNFEIKESKMRGELSQGMMCSGRELGLGEDHEGLLILASDAKVGRPLKEMVESDTMFEVEITPNRPDLLSHVGMARELGALAHLPLKGVADYGGDKTAQRAATADEVRIDDLTGCPYYTARKIRGVKVGPSPEWLQKKLQGIGLRPINNIVDITNYVLMEMGQPLHAFDAAKLQGGIIVRRAAEGEKFTALDGKEHALEAGDLVIADHQSAVALAGVMGGEHSGVTEATTDILLESAYFQTTTVRRTSRRLGMVSDSSYRFERGVDPQQVAGASALAVRLILEIAGGAADEALLTAGQPPARPATVSLDNDRCRRLLGGDVSDAEIDSILTGLGLTKTVAGWQPPTWRLDLPRPVDLVEEVARVYGIARLPAAGAALFAEESAADEFYDFRMSLRRQFAARGVWEAQTIKLISNVQLADVLGTNPQPVNPLTLKNPLSDDHTHMRPSVLPGLLATAERNIRMGRASLRFFEMGTVFSRTPDNKPVEKDALGILLSGPVSGEAWNLTTSPVADLYDLRGLIDSLCPGANVKFKPVKQSALLLAATVQVNGKSVGLCGRLWPARERALDARHPVFVAEIDTAALQKALTREVKFDEMPRFPGISRDVALEVAADVPHSKFEDFFATLKEPLLTSATLFDVFSDPTGARLPADRKSVAWTLLYRDRSKTMESAEVDTIHARVLEALKKALPVSIR